MESKFSISKELKHSTKIRSSPFNRKTTKIFKSSNKAPLQAPKKKREKCQSMRHKYTNSINNKTSSKIEDIERTHLITAIEIMKDPVQDKISRTKIGM